jgi:CubicO group peptidase (beta-lactamase class C family)
VCRTKSLGVHHERIVTSCVASAQVSEEQGVLGHEAFGGSFVVSFPAQGVSLAVLVNNLTLDKGASRQVAQFLCRELGLTLPEFLQGGMF